MKREQSPSPIRPRPATWRAWGLALGWPALLLLFVLWPFAQSGGRARAEDPPVVSFAATHMTATESALGVVLTLTLQPTHTTPITVSVSSENATAVAPDDYLPVKQRVVIAPGQSQLTIPVTLSNDARVEPDEAFYVLLSNAQGADASVAPTVTITILNDDASAIAAAGVTAVEDAGVLTFSVTLSPTSSYTTSVDYATEDDSAAAPEDYGAQAGTLVFAPGTTALTVPVALVDDAEIEPTESLWLVLSAPVSATVVVERVEALILDNDGAGPFAPERLYLPALAR
jgi:hypothetical protein